MNKIIGFILASVPIIVVVWIGAITNGFWNAIAALSIAVGVTVICLFGVWLITKDE